MNPVKIKAGNVVSVSLTWETGPGAIQSGVGTRAVKKSLGNVVNY